jgi:dihydroxyacetone kinase-like protein
MKPCLNVDQSKEMMVFVSQKMISIKDELNKADKAVGDGDHGTAMTRGFESVIEWEVQLELFSALFFVAVVMQ